MVRPRGLHLKEMHALFEGIPLPAALVDFGLFFFHNAVQLARSEEGPFFYLPKLQSHLEARWWNDVISFSEKELGIESFPVIKNEINFNLSQGELNINNLPGGVSFFMYNTIGLRVLDRTFHAVSEASIDMSSLKPGIYFVNLIRNNNVIYRKKIVLN